MLTLVGELMTRVCKRLQWVITWTPFATAAVSHANDRVTTKADRRSYRLLAQNRAGLRSLVDVAQHSLVTNDAMNTNSSNMMQASCIARRVLIPEPFFDRIARLARQYKPTLK